MKLVDVKDKACIEFRKENNNKDPKFKIGNYARISNIKMFLLKDTLRIGLMKTL